MAFAGVIVDVKSPMITIAEAIFLFMPILSHLPLTWLIEAWGGQFASAWQAGFRR
jgi:hypothetical protein